MAVRILEAVIGERAHHVDPSAILPDLMSAWHRRWKRRKRLAENTLLGEQLLGGENFLVAEFVEPAAGLSFTFQALSQDCGLPIRMAATASIDTRSPRKRVPPPGNPPSSAGRRSSAAGVATVAFAERARLGNDVGFMDEYSQ